MGRREGRKERRKEGGSGGKKEKKEGGKEGISRQDFSNFYQNFSQSTQWWCSNLQKLTY